MTRFSWSLRGFAVSVAVVTLIALAAAVSIGLAHPEPVSSGSLGPDWQCTRLALIFTSCTRVVRAEPGAAIPVGGSNPVAGSNAVAGGKDSICQRWLTWRAAAAVAR